MQSNHARHATLIALIGASLLLAVPIALAQSSNLEGARYSFVQKYENGVWTSLFYRVTGSTVTYTEGHSEGQQASMTFTITNGSFFKREPADFCIRVWNTDDCGHRGVIKDDAIYFTFLVNGRPLQPQGGWALKIPRQY